MAEGKEKKYRRISWITSIGVQLVMLLLFYFLIAWKEPFPPIPSYGIELSFGMENVGSGAEPVTNPDPVESDDAVEQQSDESVEENSEESLNEVETESLEEVVAEESVEEVPLTETPSPDVVEKTEKTSEEVIKEEVKPEPKKEVKKPEPTEKKEAEVNKEAVMPKAEEGEKNTNKGENDKEGREGKEEGTLDGRALMGEQGSSTGASLQMSGWAWDIKPDPKDNSDEEGKIQYKIKVDQDGYIIGIDLISSTVSPSVERFYRQSVERLSFSKTNEYRPAATSSGTITFIIRSK
jgi:outer membrane biosynthesis protein TonB